LFFSFLFVTSLLGQQMDIPMEKTVKIVKSDTIVLAKVKTTESNNIKVINDRVYYWYLKDKILSNVGGFHGKLLHGKYEVFVKDKLIYSGQFSNGLKNALWKQWDVQGNFIETQEWEAGQLQGEKKMYYPKGNVKEQYTYKNNVQHGVYQKWDENGVLTEKGKYKMGKKHGLIILYSEGNELKKEKYLQGELIPEKIKAEREKRKTKEEKQAERTQNPTPDENSELDEEKNSWFNKLFKKKEKQEEEEISSEENLEKKTSFFRRIFKKREKSENQD